MSEASSISGNATANKNTVESSSTGFELKEPEAIKGIDSIFINISFHVRILILSMAFALVCYLLAHLLLKSMYRDSPDVKGSLLSSVQMYQLVLEPKTQKYTLFHEGKSIDVTELTSGSLAIGKLASARGLVFDAVSRVQAYNDSLEQFLIDIASTFRQEEFKPGYYNIPLAALGYENPKLGAQASARYILQVNFGESIPSLFIEGNQRGKKRLKRLLATGKLYDASQRDKINKHIPEILPRPNFKEEITLDVKEVEKAISQINNDLEKNKSLYQFGYLPVPENVATLQSVIDGYQSFLEREVPSILDYFDSKNINCNFDNLLNKVCNLEQVENGAPANFYDRLILILNSEVGFFWSFGSWLWFEIIFLTMLGVLTECAVRLGMQYTGRDPDNIIWNPRETERTVLKLLYAPIISIVVIWTLMFTDIIKTETKIEESGIGAFVPLAFIFGLFPNIGYALLQRIAVAVFSSTSMAKPGKKAESKQVVAPVIAESGTGKPPDFKAFKDNLSDHVTAMIKK